MAIALTIILFLEPWMWLTIIFQADLLHNFSSRTVFDNVKIKKDPVEKKYNKEQPCSIATSNRQVSEV